MTDVLLAVLVVVQLLGCAGIVFGLFAVVVTLGGPRR